MREIKFRCFDHQEKEIVSADELLTIYNNRKLNESLISDEDFSFMQYTGLKDKNGVEIYEGDIIKYRGLLSSVFWSPQDFGFVTDNKILNEYSGLSFFTGYKNFEVVGNIHQNPELLKG